LSRSILRVATNALRSGHHIIAISIYLSAHPGDGHADHRVPPASKLLRRIQGVSVGSSGDRAAYQETPPGWNLF
jgi:hypothetical protein